MPTRIAVITILICLGVLLFSACGLPPLVPPVHPTVDQTLLLWQPGQQPTAVATLMLRGPSDMVAAQLHVVDRPCPELRDVALRGDIVRRGVPILTLNSASGNAPQVEIVGTFPPQQMVYGLNASQVELALSLEPNCHLILSGRELPPSNVRGWTGRIGSPGSSISIEEIVRHNDESTLTIIQNKAKVAAWPCFHWGHATSIDPVDPYTTQFSAKFLMDNGATVTADATIDVLAPRSPLIARYTIHGGPCDGQTIAATLRSW